MTGNITRRGAKSWRIKYELSRNGNSQRRTRYLTVKGTKKDAQKALTDALYAIDTGTHIDPSKESVDEYLESWLEGWAKQRVAPKTFERYTELVRQHLISGLGHHALKDLKPLHFQNFYSNTLI